MTLRTQRQFGSTQRKHILTAGDAGEVRLFVMKERVAAVHLADRGILERVPGPAYLGDVFKLTHEGKTAYEYLSQQRELQIMAQNAATLYRTITERYGTTNILARTGEHFGLTPENSSLLADYALCVVTSRELTPALRTSLDAIRRTEGEEQYQIIYNCMIYAVRAQRGQK